MRTDNNSLKEHFENYIKAVNKLKKTDIENVFLAEIFLPIAVFMKHHIKIKSFRVIEKKDAAEIESEVNKLCMELIVKRISGTLSFDYIKLAESLKDKILIDNSGIKRTEQEVNSYIWQTINSEIIENTEYFITDKERVVYKNIKEVYKDIRSTTDLEPEHNERSFHQILENEMRSKIIYLRYKYIKIKKYDHEDIRNIIEDGKTGLKGLINEIINIFGFLPDISRMFEIIKEILGINDLKPVSLDKELDYGSDNNQANLISTIVSEDKSAEDLLLDKENSKENIDINFIDSVINKHCRTEKIKEKVIKTFYIYVYDWLYNIIKNKNRAVNKDFEITQNISGIIGSGTSQIYEYKKKVKEKIINELITNKYNNNGDIDTKTLTEFYFKIKEELETRNRFIKEIKQKCEEIIGKF